MALVHQLVSFDDELDILCKIVIGDTSCVSGKFYKSDDEKHQQDDAPGRVPSCFFDYGAIATFNRVSVTGKNFGDIEIKYHLQIR